MSEYGVGVLANRFALVDLEDEEDPFEVLKRRQNEKEAKKKVDSLEKEKKSKETIIGSVNGSVAKKKPIAQKDAQKIKDDGRIKQERKNPSNDNIPERSRRPPEDSSEQMDDGFEQQRNGSFRSNRREGFQNGRPPMKGGKVFERSGNRGGRNVGGVGNRGFQGGRGGSGRPNDEDWNKSDSVLPEEEVNRRGNYRQQNQTDDDGFSRQDRRSRFPPNERMGNRGGRWRGGGVRNNRPGVDGRNDFQSNNAANGRSRSGSEGEEKPEDIGNEWTDAVSPDESNKTMEEKNNEKNESGHQNQDEENSSEEKTAEQMNQELTLDEWKAMKKRDGPTYNLRKAGEGEDLSKWKDMIKLDKKKEGDEHGSESEGEYELCEYPQRVGRQKYIKDLDFKFADRRRNTGPGNRTRNNRTGRTTDSRGFIPKNESSESNVHGGYFQKQSVPQVDDERAFPSLG